MPGVTRNPSPGRVFGRFGEVESIGGGVGHRHARRDANRQDAKDAKKVEAARQTEFDVIAAELGITMGKAKVPWKSAGDKLEVGALKLQVWEIKDVTRGAKKGDLLVIASAPADGKALLGVAFVPKDDDQSGEKIMTSIQTLAPGEAP